MKKLFVLTGLLLFLTVIALCSVRKADAFTIKLENTTQESLYFNFIWLDCDWPGMPKILPMWTGEIQPGEKLDGDVDRVGGPYRILWESMKRDGPTAEVYTFIIPNGPGIVKAIPGQAPEFTPGI